MHNTHDPQVLPIRDGVKPSCVVLPCVGQGVQGSCLDFLAQRLPAYHGQSWQARMARGEVVDELARPVQADTPLLHGLRIYYYRAVEQEPDIPFEAEILFQDEHIVVVDKPAFSAGHARWQISAKHLAGSFEKPVGLARFIARAPD